MLPQNFFIKVAKNPTFVKTMMRASSRRQSFSFRKKSSANLSSTASPKVSSKVAKENAPIFLSLAAAAAGVGTVAAVAALVESVTASSVPKFDPTLQRFDQSTFSGRFCTMLLACDPHLLLYSKTDVQQCQSMINEYQKTANDLSAEETTSPTTATDRVLWEAKRVVNSALRPDGTCDEVPRPFRMSGYVAFNGPVCVAMIASQSTPSLLFWSWVNQSQNALVNYYNRGSGGMSDETLIKSYAVAVSAALSVAFGLATFIRRRYDQNTAKSLLRYVAFPSTVVASSLNCYIVRRPEMDSGVPLVNENGIDVLPGERSKVAAAQGVYLTTASRALLQVPVYFVPPAMLAMIPTFRTFLAKTSSATVPAMTYLLLVCSGIGLPAAIAIFPQMSKIDTENVEEKYQHLKNEQTGIPYSVFYYNKGL